MKYMVISILILSICMQISMDAEEQYYNVLMHKNNEQRTGFYDTRGVPQVQGIKWKTETGMLLESPYIYNGKLYIGSDVELDSITGKKKWGEKNFDITVIYSAKMIIGRYLDSKNNVTILIGWDIDKNMVSWKNKEVIYSEIFHIHKDILYVVSRHEGGEDPPLYLLHLVNPMNGEMLETIELPDLVYGIAFWKDTLLYTGNEGIYFIDFAKKKHVPAKLFSVQEQRVHSEPVISNDTVYFGNTNGKFYAVDLKTRKIRWQKTFDKARDLSFSPSVYNGILYVSDYYTMYFLKEKDGTVLFSRDHTDTLGLPIAVTKEEIYYTSNSGYLYALDNKTGKELWNIRLAKECRVGPIVSNGVIYVAAYEKFEGQGYVFAIH